MFLADPPNITPVFLRKMLLLFNWLGPLTIIMAQQTVPYSSEQTTEASKKTVQPFLHTVLHAPPPVLLELVHAAADDVATFSRLGLLGLKTGERAGRFSDWCWFLATLVGLVENGVERQMIGALQHEGSCVHRLLDSPELTLYYPSGRTPVYGIDVGRYSQV